MERENYTMIVRPLQTEVGIEWMAEFKEVEGLAGGGMTSDEAIKELEINLPIHLEMLSELGKPIPKAIMENETLPSGKFALRMARSTHANVVSYASYEGISVNAFINMAINEKIGELICLTEIDKINKSVNLKKYSKNKTSLPILKRL